MSAQGRSAGSRRVALRLPPVSVHGQRLLGVALACALVWWAVALGLSAIEPRIWGDQVHIFRAAVAQPDTPYAVWGFVHAPWTVVLFAPFTLPPLAIATLLQTLLYFALITGLVGQYLPDAAHRQRRWLALVLALTSFFAFDAAAEMNVDWMVCIGLLVPVRYSSLFLMIKPQLAFGYYLGVPVKAWPKVALVGAVVLAASVLVWGLWPLTILEKVPRTSIGQSFNAAPQVLLPSALAWALGGLLAFFAFRRKDTLLGVLAGLFMVPYIASYSLLLPFTLLAIRVPKAALVVSLSVWLMFGLWAAGVFP